MATVTITLRDAEPGQNVLVDVEFGRPVALSERATPAQTVALQLVGLISDIERQIRELSNERKSS